MKPSGRTVRIAAWMTWTKITSVTVLRTIMGLIPSRPGAALGVLMEAGALKWGDIDGIIAMIHEIGQGYAYGPYPWCGNGHHGPLLWH